MGWWFGRKSAPADARPFVPAWLTSVSEGEGFARSFHGLTVYVRSADVDAVFRDGAWEIGQMRCSALRVDGQQVVGARSPAIASPAGGTNIDSEAREAITGVLAALRRHGLIET